MKHALRVVPDFTDAERIRILDRLVIPAERGGCIEWDGGHNGRGYSYVRLRRRMVRAHRIVLVMLTGREIQAGDVVDHECENVGCLRRDHLQRCSQAANVYLAMIRAGRPPAWLTSEELHYLERMSDDEILELLETERAS